MSNEAVAGFIISKTLQGKPLRANDYNYNDYRDKNMITYIQKKYAEQKSKIISKIERMPVKNIQIIGNAQLQIKPQAQDEQKIRNVNYELNNEVLEIMQKRLDKEQIESLLNQNQVMKKSKVWKRKPISVKQQLSVLMNQNIAQNELEELYQTYKRQSLQSNLNEFKQQQGNQAKEVQQVLVNNVFQQLEFEDQEQVNFFMRKLCQEKHLDACKLLDIPNDEIKFKEDQWDEMERWRNIVQKRLTQEQLHEIMEVEERKQNKQLVKIFKETRIDQFDPDFFKKNVKMKTMKRVNEAQDSQYHKFFVQTDQSQQIFSQEDFLRKHYSTPRITTFSRITTRPTTSTCKTQKTQQSCDFEFNNFIKQCDQIEKNFNKDHKTLNNKFFELDNMIEKAEQYNIDKPQIEREPNKDFEKFKRQRVFKKKFVTYLIDKVEKQSDLLSEKIKNVKTKQMIEHMLINEL